MSAPKFWITHDEIARYLHSSSGPAESSLGQRLLRLPHPRTGTPTLFISIQDSESGDRFWEFQSIRPDEERSWFLDNEVVSNGELILSSPIDPAYILASLIEELIVKKKIDQEKFRTSDDIFDAIASYMDETNGPAADFRRFNALPCATVALQRICESKEFAPEMFVYNFTPERWVNLLKHRAEAIAPRMSQTSRLVYVHLAKQGLCNEGADSSGLLKVGQLKAACNLLSQYITPKTYDTLLKQFDFASFDTHVQNLDSEVRARRVAKEEAAEAGDDDQSTKKRKATTQASRGVDKLKKVSTRGMNKLSSFFQAPAKAAKS